MAEMSWPTSEVTREHLQKLVSKGNMIAAEFPTCLVPMDPASLALVKGQVVVCTAFYEQGFGVSSHRFLRSLLRSYGLELYHLNPSGILHMVDFMTLCEAYIGIEPHLSLWNHFFLRMAIQVWISGTQPDRDGYGHGFFPVGGTRTRPEPRWVWVRVFFPANG
jgi:hypothetical protein